MKSLAGSDLTMFCEREKLSKQQFWQDEFATESLLFGLAKPSLGLGIAKYILSERVPRWAHSSIQKRARETKKNNRYKKFVLLQNPRLEWVMIIVFYGPPNRQSKKTTTQNSLKIFSPHGSGTQA